MADKTTETLIAALRQVLAETGEQRLYRSGKVAGLFAGRTGPPADAATRALEEGFLEVIRTETKGKATTDWVRITPRGVEFLAEHESPVRVLEELRDVLKLTREGVPLWVTEMQQELRNISSRLTENVQKLNERLETLNQRVEEALRRADLSRLQAPDGTPLVPWANETLAYLERRRDGGAPDNCPLPELFAALHQQHPNLSIPAFLDGLRRLHDRRVVNLLPFTGLPSDLPEPEYALLDAAAVLYYVSR